MLSAAGAGSALGAGHTEQTHHVGAVPPSFAQPFRALGPSLRGLSLPPGCRHAGPGRRRPAALHGAATWPAALHLLARSAGVRLRSRLPTETYVLSGRHPAAWIARQRAGSVLATPRAIAKPSRSTLWRVTQQRAVSAAQKTTLAAPAHRLTRRGRQLRRRCRPWWQRSGSPHPTVDTAGRDDS